MGTRPKFGSVPRYPALRDVRFRNRPIGGETKVRDRQSGGCLIQPPLTVSIDCGVVLSITIIVARHWNVGRISEGDVRHSTTIADADIPSTLTRAIDSNVILGITYVIGRNEQIARLSECEGVEVSSRDSGVPGYIPGVIARPVDRKIVSCVTVVIDYERNVR